MKKTIDEGCKEIQRLPYLLWNQIIKNFVVFSEYQSGGAAYLHKALNGLVG